MYYFYILRCSDLIVPHPMWNAKKTPPDFEKLFVEKNLTISLITEGYYLGFSYISCYF